MQKRKQMPDSQEFTIQEYGSQCDGVAAIEIGGELYCLACSEAILDLDTTFVCCLPDSELRTTPYRMLG